MKILVFGRTGQVATELQRQAEVLAFGREAADLSCPGECAALIDQVRPGVIINAAAYTAVDKAEDEEDLAAQINGAAPAEMACAAQKLNAPLIHISTDYVFDGTGNTPWPPDAQTAPLGAYGRSKLQGETGITQAGGSFAILRTSWVFSAHGANFVKTMLRLGKERDRLTIVADQIGGPTAAADIAAACLKIAPEMTEGRGGTGIFHFSGQPDVSWADFAREIFAQVGITCDVADIPSSDYPTPAQRPSNSRMDCTSLRQVFGIERPDWRRSLGNVLKELGEI